MVPLDGNDATKPAPAPTYEQKVAALRRRQFRYAKIEPRAIEPQQGEDPNVYSLSFSNETPVERFFGQEVLKHGPENVRMDRINSGAPFLFNHRSGDPMGVVLPGTARLDARTRTARAQIKFFPTARGQEGKTMVDNGLRNVSVGYDIYSVDEMPGGLGFNITDWEPMEISLAPVPAVTSVGFNRDADPETEHDVTVRKHVAADPAPAPAATAAVPAGGQGSNSNHSTSAAPAAERSAMEPQATGGAPALSSPQPQPPEGAMIERARQETLRGLKRNHKIPEDVFENWVRDGITGDDAARMTLDIIAQRVQSGQSEHPARLGMTGKEVRKYSVHRAIASILANGNWDKAGQEFEAHKAIRDRLNRDCGKNSFYVPVDVQEREIDDGVAFQRGFGPKSGRRDLTVASSSGGGYLVETTNQGFIDILRNRSVVMNLGARRLTGLVGNLTVPKQTSGATAYWLSTEATPITEGALVFGQLALSPKNVGAYVEISRQLLLQSSPSAEQVTMVDLAAGLSLEVDKQAIQGDGSSGKPTGILSTSGVGASASGTSLDYANLILMQADVATANALTLGGGGYATTPSVAGKLMARQRFTNTDTPLWNGNILDAMVAGFPGMSSNQMPSATALFGEWSQVIIAEWGVLEVEVNPYANFSAGIVGVRGIYTVDVGVRYGAAFSKVASIT